MNPPPEYLAERLQLWDKLKKEHNDWILKQDQKDITITLPDGKQIPGKSWKTTPYEVAAGIR